MPLCMGCLNEIPTDGAVCGVCGFDNGQPQSAPYLPYGTVLNNKYVVAKNLETNGESTRYLGYDKTTGKIIAVREFLPIGLFDRSAGEEKIFVSPQDKEKFTEAQTAFQSYYEALASLTDTSSFIAVLDAFAANNTYYVIEENDDLITFAEYVQHNNGNLEWDVARPLFMPLITLLENLHKAGIGHYAVSPSNLFVTAAGKLKLGGFSTENERKRGTMLKSQLYSGCAAPEQYLSDSTLDIATDIYGLTATLFYALTGNLPANAKEREKDSRLLISTNTVKRLPPHVVTALANGLQLKREQRIADFDDLRAQLSVASTVQAIQDQISRTASMTPIKSESSRQKKVRPAAVGIVAAIVALLLFSSVGLYWLATDPFNGVFGGSDSSDDAPAATEPPEEEPWTGPLVKDYTGMALKDVEADFPGKVEVSAEGVYSDSVPKDYVISQDPAAGQPLKDQNSVLYLVLSKGTRYKVLPEIGGKQFSDVAAELTDMGFIVTQQADFNSYYGEGVVIGYVNHYTGDQVETGAEVMIKVSRGSASVPDNTGYDSGSDSGSDTADDSSDNADDTSDDWQGGYGDDADYDADQD